MIHGDADWGEPEALAPSQEFHGVLLCWGWPPNVDIGATGIADLVDVPPVSSHRLGIQLRGDRSPDLSEQADKTWWLTMFVYEGLEAMHADRLSRYLQPTLCRESRSALLWMPSIRLPSELPRRELLSRAVHVLPQDVVDRILHAAQHLQQYGSFPRASKRHHNIAFQEVSRLNTPGPRPRLNSALTSSASSHVLPMPQAMATETLPKWDDFGKTLLDHTSSPPVFWLQPGLGDATLSTRAAMDIVKMQLMYKCRIDVFIRRK